MLSATMVLAQGHSWQGIHQPSIQEMASNFGGVTPSEFASHVIWGWEGPMSLETIRHDLDSIKTKGFRSVIFEAGYHLPYEYLSEGWFEGIRTGVLEAKARGLKVWIIDEGKYPSGFAGGKFTRERPDLRMKALVVVDTIHVQKAGILKEASVNPKAFSAVAVSRSGRPNRLVEIRDGKIDFIAGLDDWDILLVGSDYRTGQTRAVNNPSGGKDTKNSICDYLSPEAVRQFIDWTHEQYKKYIGDEFGKTVLGFRGDEPDFAYTPWTPKMVEEFMERKGYDPTPYFASLLTRNLSVSERRFRADFWDVWSELFSKNFFKQQADWCEANGLAYITHLNNDHNMPVCVRAEGNFFRDLKVVQVPGVDAIWNQIWPGTVNDFPKFASSVSHVYGKPRAFSESFAAYYTSPSIPQAKYVADYQMVRGINFFEYMFWMAGSRGTTWMTDPAMRGFNDYTNRATYIMTQGRPGARVAVYYPTSTLWLGDQSVVPDLVEISQLLLKHQRDFDWVDDDAFTDALRVGTGYFENKSGQTYDCLVIPSCDVISLGAWKQISEFVRGGGRLLFWGRKPTGLAGRTFLSPEPFPDTPDCFWEPSLSWTAEVEAAMPEPEFALVLPKKPMQPRKAQAGEPEPVDPTDFIRYTRRVVGDAVFYFIFNEGETECEFKAQLDARGVVKEWDAIDGYVRDKAVEQEGAKTLIQMKLSPWESTIISVEKSGGEYNVRRMGVKSGGSLQTVAIQKVIDQAAKTGGTVVFPAGKYLSGALFFPRGVNLRVEKGAVLQGSELPSEYPVIKTRFEGIEREWRCAFLNFDNSPGVSVSGEGTIDGNGLKWNKVPFGATGRPRLVCFTNCDGGKISGLKLQNQASWCVHVLYTRGFTIDGLNITAKEYIPSSDGIDIDSSSDVLITGTYIYVHDDCISIKSGKDEDGRRVGRPGENILIENCHFAYGHGGVTMGSEISGSIRHVTTRNCKVDAGNWGPIRFKSQPSRGGVVEDIVFEDMEIADAVNILDVNLEWRPGHSKTEPVYSDPVTQLRGVVIRRVKASAKSIGNMYGFDCSPLGRDSFYFEDCEFKAQTGLKLKAASEVDFTGVKMEVSEGETFISR